MDSEHVYNISKVSKVPEVLLETTVFEAAKSGDEAALGQVYDTYFDQIYRFIYYRTSHQQTAEDITEDVFIKAFKGLSGMKGGADKLRGWLYQIARNSVIDHYRTVAETLPIEGLENLVSYESSIVNTLELAGDSAQVMNVLHTLPSEQQAVVKMRFLEELDISEIAVLLGKSEGNVRIIQYRALTKLRNALANTSEE